MKTSMVQVREGEHLGPVDWSYNFRQHFDCYCTNDAGKQKECDRHVAMLRQVVEGIERGESWQATTDGGWPRIGWGRVLQVGMYDGWPYWKPVPSVCIETFMGSEWHAFSCLTDVAMKTPEGAPHENQ